MNKSLIFILFAFAFLVATTSALNTPILKKSILFRDGERVVMDTFRTRNATIACSGDHPELYSLTPVYRALDFQPSNATQILFNLTILCDEQYYLYRRLIYSEIDDTLYYFCGKNRTLLILDPIAFEVQREIRLGINYFPYLDIVKLYPENDSMVILLINSGSHNYGHDFDYSMFLRVNLTTQKVTQNFTLDRGLGLRESVVSYANNGTNSFVLTNSYATQMKNFTVYALNVSGNDYNLSRLYGETLNFSKAVPFNLVDVYSQLYVAGDLLMTNNNNSILFFNAQGQLLSKVDNLTLNLFDMVGWRKYPAFFEGRNKTFYYESNSVITQFTVEGTTIHTKLQMNGSRLQIARGSSQLGDQIFYLQKESTYDDSYWYVFDLDTSKIISQVPQVYSSVFTTDDTYGILHNKTISVFSWSVDAFLGKLKIEQNGGSNDEFYYYDSENSFFYYLRYPMTPSQCVFVQFDIKTGVSRNISSLNGPSLCLGRITQVNSTSLDFVIEDKKGGYFINSNRYGQANFTYPIELFKKGFAAVNFTNNLTIDLIHYSASILDWNHSFFIFDNKSRLFTFQNASEVKYIDNRYPTTFHYFGGQKVFASLKGMFTSIDLKTHVGVAHYIDFNNSIASKLFGNNGNNEDEGYIITDKGINSGNLYFYNITTDGCTPFPKQKRTLNASASGRCKYFRSFGYNESESVVNIYDFCAGSEPEKVPFIQKLLRGYSK